MSPRSVLEWAACVTSDLLPGQSATLAAPVAAAVRTERLNLASIGRKMAGAVAAKPTIKRAWRFTCNRRVEVHRAMAGVIRRLTRRREEPLIVSLDRTDVRDFHALMAAACIGGRAAPLLRASYPGASLRRSQNSLEGRLLRKLRALIPGSVPVTILADRGFGRAEWAAVRRELKSRHVVRIRPDVAICRSRYRGISREYPTSRGMAHLLKGAGHRKDRRVEHNVAIRWRPDLPKGRDEPRSLMTDLERKAEPTCQLHGRRMSIAGLFRDGKSKRDGQSLRGTRIGKADRFDRFLLVVALAYIVPVGHGLRAKLDHDPSAWCTTRRERECGVLTIGKAMVDRLGCSPDQILRMIRWATIEVGSKWG